MAKIEVRRATLADIERFVRATNPDYFIGQVNGHDVGIATFHDMNGRRWVQFALASGAHVFGVDIVRALRRGLAENAKGTVFALCQELHNSKRLLSALGFEATLEMRAGAEVWVREAPENG